MISCCFRVIWCLIVSRLSYAYFNLVLCLLKFVCFMIFNTPFNNISVISWRTVLLLEETGVPRENHHPVASHWRTVSHNVASSTPRHERGSNSQLWWCLAPIAQVFVNPTTIILLLFKSKWQLNWTLFFNKQLHLDISFSCDNIKLKHNRSRTKNQNKNYTKH
jgi:hypothetical protein